MQTDFHHGVTYVLARLSGFSAEQAAVVAHSSQYVDDATSSGIVQFDNGAMYQRTSSAHKMLDYRNFEELANHTVWLPFHFLPGNGGLPAGSEPEGGFVEKLVCRPDSPPARDMLRACITARSVPYGLYRLGITMHVYADTWAHQGFVGVSHERNHARDITGADGKPDSSLAERLKSFFIGEALPLGHGTVLSNPDKPYLVWSYTDGRGQRVERNNPRDYLAASDAMSAAMQRYLSGDPDAAVRPLPERDRNILESLFNGLMDGEEARHREWLDAIEKGIFSFGAEKVRYVATGVGSWKHDALGAPLEADEDDDEDQKFGYRPEFLRSHWKMFHDALQSHRFEVLHMILPRYGICAA